MVAARNNLVIEQGATFRYDIFYRENGVAIDLTGYAADMHVRKSVLDQTFIVELSTFNDRILIDGPAGKITLLLTDAETRALNFETGVYDLEIISPDPDNVVTRLMEGDVKFSKEVTRSVSRAGGTVDP